MASALKFTMLSNLIFPPNNVKIEFNLKMCEIKTDQFSSQRRDQEADKPECSHHNKGAKSCPHISHMKKETTVCFFSCVFSNRAAVSLFLDLWATQGLFLDHKIGSK